MATRALETRREMDFEPYRRDGFQVLRGVVDASRVERWRAGCDRLREQAIGGSLDENRVRVLRQRTAAGETVRGVQQAHRISAVVDAIRLDPDLAKIQFALLGRDLATVVTALFWKSKDDAVTGFAWHQDAHFRQPREAFRDLAGSYLQVAVALDPQDPDNGGLRFVRGSHAGATLFEHRPESVLAGDASDAELVAGFGDRFAASDVRHVVLEPGDCVIWNAYTLHGSPPNRSGAGLRRSLAMGTIRAAAADVGDPAFVDGRPVAAV